MKFKSALVTQASGSIGGMTASRNKGGMYFRSRAMPINPNTPQQAQIRAYMATVALSWTNPTIGIDINGWQDYARNTPLLDSLGETRPIPALAMYCRSMVPRLQAGLDQLLAAPAIDTLSDTGYLWFSASEATQLITVNWLGDPEWTEDAAGGLMLAVSRPQNQSINFFKGPYRYADIVLGDDIAAPTSPQTFAPPFPFVEDDKLFVQARSTTADGRLSYPFRDTFIAAA